MKCVSYAFGMLAVLSIWTMQSVIAGPDTEALKESVKLGRNLVEKLKVSQEKLHRDSLGKNDAEERAAIVQSAISELKVIVADFREQRPISEGVVEVGYDYLRYLEARLRRRELPLIVREYLNVLSDLVKQAITYSAPFMPEDYHYATTQVSEAVFNKQVSSSDEFFWGLILNLGSKNQVIFHVETVEVLLGNIERLARTKKGQAERDPMVVHFLDTAVKLMNQALGSQNEKDKAKIGILIEKVLRWPEREFDAGIIATVKKRLLDIARKLNLDIPFSENSQMAHDARIFLSKYKAAMSRNRLRNRCESEVF